MHYKYTIPRYIGVEPIHKLINQNVLLQSIFTFECVIFRFDLCVFFFFVVL